MTEHIKVGMAELKIAASGEILKTTGLGSCVGLTLYDAGARVAGLAHIMLPSSEIAKEAAFNRAKYADTALPVLIELMTKAGASARRLTAKLAGGAQMFIFAGQSDTMRIGPRNVETCKLLLVGNRIPLVAEDTGASYGRTIELDSGTGLLTIRSVQYGIKEL
ncbi:chemotaxis protein CheD [Paenibacillus darwinianus]|uniref:Probable chemoreceptor glutamine deamidase CheD n=1 Tax=Paenibacillus darwinianus TaxID=1380763 RepID=A0A9W5S3H8_9BACL|nr:chemotaxis protein CheD [Paenibacillus darwinianus]EXX91267.1 chemotaxis protein CheD [Paenibacillus darwinianus]EXX92205.1 chemotaxis protein CheD [Paenibacillus darwinianus]EXX92815.1 chemotaxis protein CheD [Paenibacillus darwinianus]